MNDTLRELKQHMIKAEVEVMAALQEKATSEHLLHQNVQLIQVR